jgi:hypothetical protein
MTRANWLWDLAAWLSLPLLAMLAGVMVRKRRYGDFPFFFAYVLMACLVGVIRFAIYKYFSQNLYFYVYWTSDFVIAVVTFLAIYEVFVEKTFPQFFRIRLYRSLFPAVIVVIVVLAFLTALANPNRAAAFFITSRAFDFLRTAMIGVVVLLMLMMGRRSRKHEFSIAFGFGIQAAFTLINAALTTRAGYKANVLAPFEPIVYDAACLIWLCSFLGSPEPLPSETQAALSPEHLQQVRSWEKVLKEWLSPRKRLF